MTPGTKFRATTKHCTYLYKYIGIIQEVGDCYNILLFNIDTGRTLFVEKEWFNQRKIEEIE